MKNSNLTFSDFCDAFHSSQYKENFTYSGKRSLYDHLTELEAETEEEIELDVCSLCCDYHEDDLARVLANYSLDDLDDLKNNTSVIDFDKETGLVIFAIY